MKTKDLNKNVTDLIFKEVKKKIIQESEGSKKEVYHIKCEGIPLASFNTQEEAEEALPRYKDKNDGELIIEKGIYESHDDMIDKLDEMNDELSEEEDSMEGNAFTKALKDTPKGEKFNLGNKEYIDTSDVDENEEDCNECGDKDMMEKLHGGQTELDKNKDGKLTKSDFLMMLKNKGNKKEVETKESEFDQWLSDADTQSDESGEKEVEESKHVCNECGGSMNEEGMCNECGYGSKMESKKKVVRMNETEMIKMIKKMVKESIPGLDITNRVKKDSETSNKKNISDVSAKIKDALSFSNNDNPEFPHQIGKAKEKMARKNSSKEDEIVSDIRGGGLEDLNIENPSENFKKRLKMSLEGDALMGNSHEYANAVKSDVGKKLADKAERKDKKIKSEPEISWGHSWKDPEKVNVVNESEKTKLSTILEEEIKKMKNMAVYNKKTQ
jgi:ribosomal protein L37E